MNFHINNVGLKKKSNGTFRQLPKLYLVRALKNTVMGSTWKFWETNEDAKFLEQLHKKINENDSSHMGEKKKT